MLLNVADFFSKTLQKKFNINLKRLGMVGSFRDEVESRALKAYDHSDWVNAPSPPMSLTAYATQDSEIIC